MKMEIIDKISYTTEASLLCVGYVNGKSNNEIIDKIIKKEKNPLAKQYTKTILKIMNEVNELQSAYHDILEKYYQKIPGLECTIIESLFIDLYEKRCDSLEDYEKQLSKLNQEEINYILMNNLNNEIFLKDINVVTTSELFKVIRQLNIEDKMQLLLIDIAINWQEHLEVLKPLFTKIVKLLKKYTKELNEINQFGITNIKAQSNLLAQLENAASFRFDDITQYEFEIGTMIFQPFFVTMKISNNEKQVFLNYGALFNFEYVAIKKELTKENILELTKILADPTKLEILKLLAKGRAYGKEIVDETGLTPATISHHMQALNHANFVSVHLEMNKTYYQIEKDNILLGINRIKDYIEEL